MDKSNHVVRNNDTTMTRTISDERYWCEYNNFQREKHNIIKNYLNGWFPKLAKWNNKLLYLDTHAGRGKHISGKLGSPLVALETLLNHTYFPKLNNCEFTFNFIERNRSNYESLMGDLKEYNLPANVKCNPIEEDCFNILEEMITFLNTPAFIFIDPFGFKIPGKLLRDLMSIKKVELFVNIIWRELDMAICQKTKPSGMMKTLDLIFNGGIWQTITDNDPDKRADQAAKLIQEMTGSKWSTYISMIGENHKTRYFLLHLTNHDDGRDLMKECMWKSCPDGGFYVKKVHNPDQLFLIEPEPDLELLDEWIISELKNQPQRWENLIIKIRKEIWLTKHFNQEIQKLRKKGIIEGKDYDGKFARTNNPIIHMRQ